MAYLIDDLIHNKKKTKDPIHPINDIWVIARPVPGPFITRLHDAWLVLIGKADAVVYRDTE